MKEGRKEGSIVICNGRSRAPPTVILLERMITRDLPLEVSLPIMGERWVTVLIQTEQD